MGRPLSPPALYPRTEQATPEFVMAAS